LKREWDFDQEDIGRITGVMRYITGREMGWRAGELRLQFHKKVPDYAQLYFKRM